MDYDLPIDTGEVQEPFTLPVAMPTKEDAISIRPIQEARPEPISEQQRAEPIIHESGKQLIAVDHNPWLDTEFSKGTKFGNRLFGLAGEERYQTWLEKLLRSGSTAAGDALAGKLPQYEVDPVSGDVHTNPQMVERALDMAALAGTGGLAGATDATLGATPFLRPALKYKDKLYKGKEGQQHLDVIPKEIYPEFERQAMTGEDLSNFKFGFINEKGHFLDREAALKHAIDTGLIDKHAGQYGALTSTLMADSSKPGTAIEAMAKSKAPTFYSAVEHQINSITQSKMTGEQWLGTLSNKPGVKPEELQWTGLTDFLNENKSKPVTKEQVQEHLAANKIELNEVGKGQASAEDIKAAKDAYKEFEDYSEVLGEKYNLNPLQNLAMHSKLKNMDPAEVAKYTELQKRYIETKNASETGDTKYHGYQLPGGENYREMLLRLPERSQNGFKVVPNPEGNGFSIQHANGEYVKGFGDKPASWSTEHLARTTGMEFAPKAKIQNRLEKIQDEFNDLHLLEELEQLPKGLDVIKKRRELAEERNNLQSELMNLKQNGPKENPNYRSSHWDEPNILAHVRMNDRVMSEPGYAVQNTRTGNKSKVFATEDEAKAYQATLPASVTTKIVSDNLHKKSLHLEEIQSDWHQQGRDRGYIDPKAVAKAEAQTKERTRLIEVYGKSAFDQALLDRFPADPVAAKELKAYVDQIELGEIKGRNGVQDEPFKKSWKELALKRMIREAAEKGYDRLSWTPGEAQAARYNLRKQIEKLSYNPKQQYLKAWDAKGAEVIVKDSVKPEDLPNLIGKEAADKLLKQEPENFERVPSVKKEDLKVTQTEHQYVVTNKDKRAVKIGKGTVGSEAEALEYAERHLNKTAFEVNNNRELEYGRLGPTHILKGQDLEVGGEGMKGFYDQIIPKALEKIGKEHGVKVKTAEIQKEGKVKVFRGDELSNQFVSEADARSWINRTFSPETAKNYRIEHETMPIHYIDIPQSLKDAAMHKGFPLFSKGVPLPLMPVEHDPWEKKK